MGAIKRKAAKRYAAYVSRSVYDGVRKLSPKTAAQLKAHALKTQRSAPRAAAKRKKV